MRGTAGARMALHDLLPCDPPLCPQLSGEMVGQLQTVPDMHTRKALMAKQADGFIAMPGGWVAPPARSAQGKGRLPPCPVRSAPCDSHTVAPCRLPAASPLDA
jgi:hypothetical protein